MKILTNTKVMLSSDAYCGQMYKENMNGCDQKPNYSLSRENASRELHMHKSKPLIVLSNAAGSKKLDKHVYEGIDALAAWNNPPILFQRGGRLVDICRDGPIYRIVEVPQKSLKLILAEAATWIHLPRTKDEKGSGKKDKENKKDLDEDNSIKHELMKEKSSEKKYMDSEIPQKKIQIYHRLPQ